MVRWHVCLKCTANKDHYEYSEDNSVVDYSVVSNHALLCRYEYVDAVSKDLGTYTVISRRINIIALCCVLGLLITTMPSQVHPQSFTVQG